MKCDGYSLEYKAKGVLKYINLLLGNTVSLELPFNSILYVKHKRGLFGRMVLYIHSHKLGRQGLKVKRLQPIIWINRSIRSAMEAEVNKMIVQNLEGRNLMLKNIHRKQVHQFYRLIGSSQRNKNRNLDKVKGIHVEASKSGFDKKIYTASLTSH